MTPSARVKSSAAWREWSERAPAAVTLLLIVLLPLEMVRSGASLMHGRFAPANGTLVPDAGAGGHPAQRRRRQAGASAASLIVRAHLFGVSSLSNNPTTGIPTSHAKLVLQGTFAFGRPEEGAAIIADSNGARLYSAGNAIDDAVLRRVYIDHVILERHGQLESLALPISAPSSYAAASQARTVDMRPGLHDPRSLGDVMRAEPVLDDAGQVMGVKVYSGRNRAAFANAGLRGGDVVTAIDGVPLAADPSAKPLAAFDQVRTSGSATLTVLRGARSSLNVYVLYP